MLKIYFYNIIHKIIFLFILVTVFFPGFVNAQSELENLLSPSGLPVLKQSRLIEVSSYDTTGGNGDSWTVKPGATSTVFNEKGPGVITRIWMTVYSPDPYFLRKILIKMYWDGESNPSVEVPLGDFFGTGFKYKQYIGRYTGMSSGGYYCYFPMPFQKAARIEIVNQSDQEISDLYFQVDYQKLQKPLSKNVAYFHAWWNREIRTYSKNNFLILNAKGRGQVVGVNMSMQSYNNNYRYLEGDEMVYVDGEKKPSINGTGTEDFFNSGWYFMDGEFSAPDHGLIIKNDSLHRIAAYRFMIGDQVPFRKSIKFTIEHGDRDGEVADYSSTAYWYQKEPHQKFPPMMRASLRIPLRVAVPNRVIEAEALGASGTDIQSSTENMEKYGPDWSNLKQLEINLEKKEGSCFISIPVSHTDRYNVDIYYTKGPSYCNVDIMYDGKKIGKIEGYKSEVYPGGALTINDLRSHKNKLKLEFIARGKNRKSAGYMLGIDAFNPVPNRVFIPEWCLVGPFPNPIDSSGNSEGLNIVYPPEKEFDTTKTYIGADNQQLKWKLFKTPENGHISLTGLIHPHEYVVSYAVTYVYSPKEQRMPLLVGTDEGSKIFLNEKLIYEFKGSRSAEVDQNKIMAELDKGWNKLEIKIDNRTGGYGFYARFLDLNRVLSYSPYKNF